MKKFVSVLLCCMLMFIAVLPITAFAWETPELMLNVSYNEKKNEITVEYRVNNFAGTESADFRLKFDPEAVEFKDYTAAKIDDTFIEIDEMPDEEGKIAIQFVDLYCVQPEDCDDDGSAAVATLTFSVIDESATETVFVATADSCAMDPDSQDVALKRYTQKISLTASEDESAGSDTASSFSNPNVKKIIVIAVITFIVLVAGTAAVVIKYRKS